MGSLFEWAFAARCLALPSMQQEEIKYDVAVVGGGCVGLASAYKIQRRHPDWRIVVFEKEDHLAPHQTGHNSGVIHSGIYYKPGSYRAKNCVDGRRELVAFAREHDISHDICGKLIVAVEEEELGRLEGIYERGLENGIEDMRKVTAEEMREIEPHVQGIAGVHVGCTGIIDFVGVVEKLAELLVKIQPKSQVLTDCKVLDYEGDRPRTIRTTKGTFTAERMVFCGGLFADRLARKDGIREKMQVVGFRGDYYELVDEAKHKVKHLVYPVPNPAFPFLGVHLTRMYNGEIECGPNAVFTFKREGYGKTSFNLRDALQATTYSGTWRLFFKHTKFGIREQRRAWSKRLFLKTLQRLVPSFEMKDLKPGRAGVRAMALLPNGEVHDDFLFAERDGAVHVLNAPSPAATACLAIGEEVAERVDRYLE